jgi:sugar lactone lactonase YvrE
MADWTVIARDVRDTLGEGLLWSARDNAVYWTDILAPRSTGCHSPMAR